MEKEFIPYEQAVALKELGFDEPCLGLFKEDSSFLYADVFAFRDPYTPSEFKEGVDEGVCYINSEILEESTTAPTYSHAFRWFREKYNLSYSIDWMTRNKDYYNGYFVHFRGINGHRLNEDNFIVLNDELPPEGYGVYKTYEEAELACLRKLIEIVKTK